MPRKTKQNEITSPELLSQVNPDNVRLKQDFIAYLQSVQRSPKTIAGYSNDIDIFWVWNLQNNGNKFFPKISKRDYAAYQHWLINENGNSPARVRRLKSAISSLSNYVENILDDEDEFKDFRSTVRKIENPAMQQVRKKTVWSDEALDKLLDDLLASGQNKKACDEHEGCFLPYLYVQLKDGYTLDDVRDKINACLPERYMRPVEIFTVPERPFFHFKTNRIGLSKEIIAKRNQQKEKAKRNSFADGCIA